MTQFIYPPVVLDKTGLATEAEQQTQTSILQDIDATVINIDATASNIDTNVGNILTIATATNNKIPAQGQALASASLPVVLTAAQISTLTPLSTVNVGNFPASQAVTGSFLTDAQLRATPVPISGTVSTGGLTDAQLRAAAVPVLLASTTVTNTVAVSAATLPLPAGAATSALQTTTNSSLSSIDIKTPALGQALAAASTPVVLTAAQVATLTPLTSISVSNFPATQTVAGTVAVSNFPASQAVTGTFFQATQPISAAALPLPSGASTLAAQTTMEAAINTLLKPASTLAAVTSVGTVGAVTAITNALPTGANVIGALTANQSTNTNQIAGTAVSVGIGPSNAGTQRSVQSNVATATVTSVASSATTVSLWTSNANRRGATIYNESTATLYVKFGATASLTSYTVQIASGGYYELPQPIYSGAVDGIWSAANGSARLTEY